MPTTGPTILPASVSDQARFGYDVAIAGDVLVAGADRHSYQGQSNFRGAVSVFRRDGLGAWIEDPQILNATSADNGFFGHAVEISAAGDLVAASVPGNFQVAGLPPGEVVTYEFDAGLGTWLETGRFSASDGESSDNFGRSMSMTPDGTRMLVGAPGRTDRGAAYVFDFDAVSGLWLETGRLQPASGKSQFGISVSLDPSGELAIVGDDGWDSFSGAAFIYRRDPGTGMWMEEQRLDAPAAYNFSRFGIASAIRGDLAVVGADDNSGLLNNIGEPGSGAVYLYRRDPVSGIWGAETDLQGPLQIRATDPIGNSTTQSSFGFSLDLSNDPFERLVVGAYSHDGGAEIFRLGAARMYRNDGGSWIQEAEIFSPDGIEDHRFGWAVDLDGDQLAIGAAGWDEIGRRNQDLGAAYVYDISSCTPPTPVCACEIDGNDAQVDVFDLLAYLSLWFAQDAAADIDGTPGVDVFDLLDFLSCWFPASAGNCP